MKSAKPRRPPKQDALASASFPELTSHQLPVAKAAFCRLKAQGQIME
jgi:hypothetical protein